MIGVYNHLLCKEFRFHYHSQKVIGSLGHTCMIWVWVSPYNQDFSRPVGRLWMWLKGSYSTLKGCATGFLTTKHTKQQPHWNKNTPDWQTNKHTNNNDDVNNSNNNNNHLGQFNSQQQWINNQNFKIFDQSSNWPHLKNYLGDRIQFDTYWNSTNWKDFIDQIKEVRHGENNQVKKFINQWRWLEGSHSEQCWNGCSPARRVCESLGACKILQGVSKSH